MTPSEALSLLDQAAATLHLDRHDHLSLIEAVEVLRAVVRDYDQDGDRHHHHEDATQLPRGRGTILID